MSEHLPIILIELVLVFGGVLLFAWWQLREIRIDQQKAAAERARQAALDAGHPTGTASPPAPADDAPPTR